MPLTYIKARGRNRAQTRLADRFGKPIVTDMSLPGRARARAPDFQPAYRRLLTFFLEEYAPGARETLGASQLPDGERFYQAQIRRYVTEDMTPTFEHDGVVAVVPHVASRTIEVIGRRGEFDPKRLIAAYEAAGLELRRVKTGR